MMTGVATMVAMTSAAVAQSQTAGWAWDCRRRRSRNSGGDRLSLKRLTGSAEGAGGGGGVSVLGFFLVGIFFSWLFFSCGWLNHPYVKIGFLQNFGCKRATRLHAKIIILAAESLVASVRHMSKSEY